MKDKEEDEGARNPAGKVNQQEHGRIVETHLAVGESLKKLFLACFGRDPAADTMKDDVIDQDEESDEKEMEGIELDPDPFCNKGADGDDGRNPPAKFDEPERPFPQLAQNDPSAPAQLSGQVELLVDHTFLRNPSPAERPATTAITRDRP